MANLQRHRAHESLNIDTAADWQAQTIISVTGTAGNVDVTNYHMVHLQPVEDIYFTFSIDSTETNLVPGNDLYLKGGDTIYSFKIPRGLGDTIYLLMERVTDTGNVRVILS